jgi:peptide/nickel transport system substrate-binding protein
MRKAVAYAIDDNEILEKAYLNDAVLTDSIYYPNFLGVEDAAKSYIFDLDKTSLLLSKKGYKDEDSNGLLEDKNGKGIDVKILVNSNNANRIAAAKFISSDLKTAGFNVTVESLPWEEYQNAIKSKNFDILITGYVIEETFDLRTFFNGKAPWGYMNQSLHEQVRNLDRLYEADEYPKHYEKLKEMLNEEMPYYPLVYKKMGLIGTGTFEAKDLPMFNNIYQNIGTWSWTKISNEENQ